MKKGPLLKKRLKKVKKGHFEKKKLKKVIKGPYTPCSLIFNIIVQYFDLK